MVTVHLTGKDYARKKLAVRVDEFKRDDGYFQPDERETAIKFLRGSAARASFVLPALYSALGARSLPADSARTQWQSVQAAALEQSALHTIALACRAIFDDDKAGLTGKRIARLSDETLSFVAGYWSEHSERSEEEATQALAFLKRLFIRCAQPRKDLLKKPSLLEPRIGLLKYYADRHAAHITLGHYRFDILDLIHVAAAIVVIGAIIVDFDDPSRGDQYFDSIDEGGWQAAKGVFPHLPIERIFKSWSIHRQAAIIWKESFGDGVEYILDKLPMAIGYWDSDPD